VEFGKGGLRPWPRFGKGCGKAITFTIVIVMLWQRFGLGKGLAKMEWKRLGLAKGVSTKALANLCHVAYDPREDISIEVVRIRHSTLAAAKRLGSGV